MVDLIIGEDMRTALIASLIAILGLFSVVPAFAFDVNYGGHFYTWLSSDSQSNYAELYDVDAGSNDGIACFSNISTIPIFKISERCDSIPLNSSISIYSAYSRKLTYPGIFSVSENYSDFSGLSFLGMRADIKMKGKSLWVAGLYGNDDCCQYNIYDKCCSSYLVAAGADADVGIARFHGKFLYAAGNDNTDYNNNDLIAFDSPLRMAWIGQPYYSAEIMGYGKFDNILSSGVSPFSRISSVAALNLGASIKPMDKLTLRGDIWYAKLADKDSSKNTLGSEIDLVVTYELIEDLKFDIVGAYLFSGDGVDAKLAPGKQLKDDNNSYPYELGARLSLSF